MTKDHTRGAVVRDRAGKFTKRTTPPKKPTSASRDPQRDATPAPPTSRLTVTNNAGVINTRFTRTYKE
jgi:hypothetical protein